LSRKPRREFIGGLYHVINRGNRREKIFHEDKDYRKFEECLGITQKRYPFICHCYEIMPNHFHLLIKTLNNSLARIMRSITTRYAQYYNKKYNKQGLVFQGRYRSIICQEDRYLLALVRYLTLNAPRAGLVGSPEKWYWSSFKVLFGGKSPVKIDVKTVIEYFDSDPKVAREKFLEFIKDGMENPPDFGVYPSEEFPILGDEKFIDKINREYGELRRKTQENLKLGLLELSKIVCDKFGLLNEDLISDSKGGLITKARWVFCYIANMYCKHKISGIAQYLGKNQSTVTWAIKEVRKNPKIKNEIEKIIQLRTAISTSQERPHDP